MKVKISRKSLTYFHEIVYDSKNKEGVLSDGIKTSYNPSIFEFKILNIIENWPKELADESIIDGLSYEIKIKDEGELRTYSFKNKFPSDIIRLECLINDIIGAELDV